MDMQAIVAYSALWAILSAYALLATLDFGAGFYYWLAGLHREREPHRRVRTLTLRYLSPVWETTNVFLILFIVGMIGFFPGAVSPLATGLLLPASLAAIVLALRGAFFAFHHLAPWADRALAPAFGLGGLLVPALLVSFFSATEDGAIRVDAAGVVHVSQATLWLSPLNLALALLALALAAYVSAAFLARYAAQRHDGEVAAFYRAAALRAGALTALLAVMSGVALRIVAPFHFAALAAAWPVHLVIAALFILGMWALATGGRRWSGPAVGAVFAQLALGVLTFGFARLPYLLYPGVTVNDALTPPATFTALAITVVAGTVVVLPGLWLLYTLFVRPPPRSNVAAVEAQARDGKGREPEGSRT
jgi:cytochrome d ubiquinol oxidase subunit II